MALRTGLSAHVIRIWEQRYHAVEPERTETNRRLYSPEQIERLSLLREVTRAGHGIGQVAQWPIDKLRQLAAEGRGAEIPEAPPPARIPARTTPAFLEECLEAIRSLDARALDDTLQRGATHLGGQGLLQKVVAPLAQKIGELWREGALTAAHEHFATAALRVFLGSAAKPFGPMENAPVLMVATPAGQVHELGALLVAATAANLGWQVTYLGASLPAADIAGAAHLGKARAVALSLVYPEDDPRLGGELLRLRQSLPAEMPILVGGRAAYAYREALGKVEALLMRDLAHLSTTLERLRRPEKQSGG